MVDKSDTERAAVKAARRPFAEVLTELGLMTVFRDRSAADVDRLIEAAVDGYRAHLQGILGTTKKALDDLSDPIPF